MNELTNYNGYFNMTKSMQKVYPLVMNFIWCDGPTFSFAHFLKYKKNGNLDDGYWIRSGMIISDIADAVEAGEEIDWCPYISHKADIIEKGYMAHIMNVTNKMGKYNIHNYHGNISDRVLDILSKAVIRECENRNIFLFKTNLTDSIKEICKRDLNRNISDETALVLTYLIGSGRCDDITVHNAIILLLI